MPFAGVVIIHATCLLPFAILTCSCKCRDHQEARAPVLMAWRQLGNDLFKKKEYSKAIMAYSTELTEHSDDHLLISNRAEAFLKLGQYTEAYHDALNVTQLCDTDVKGHYRLGRALTGLDRFEEARTSLETAYRLDRSNRAVFEELKSARALVQSRRKVKWSCLLQTVLGEAKKERVLKSSQDDYVGDVEIQHSWIGKGRGLYATQDIPAGAVILACKAICTAYVDELEGLPPKDEDSNRLVDCLVTKLAKKLDGSNVHEARELQEQLSQLSAGSGPPAPRDTSRQDEADQLEATCEWVKPIVKHNAFSSTSWDPMSSMLYSSSDEEGALKEAGVKFNSKNMKFGYGLWNLPSYVNHSCLFNAFRFTIGNFFFLISNRVITATEEITTFYVRPDEPDRQLVFENDYGFTCKCRLCVAEQTIPSNAKGYMKEAEKILEDVSEKVMKYDEDCMGDLNLSLTCLRQADDRKLLRPNRLLCNVLTSLVLMYAHHRQWQFASGALENAFDALVGKPNKEEDPYSLEEPFGGGSASPEPLLVELATQLSCALSRQRRFNEARKWLNRARDLSLLMYAIEDVADMCFGKHFRLAEQGLSEDNKKRKSKK